jgi:hypothetical protein
MVDPISLATVTAALTVLGTECAKGVASEAGKTLWAKTMGLLGWTKHLEEKEIPKEIATRLHDDQALLDQVITILQNANTSDSSVKMVGSLVENVTADKVIVAQKVDSIIM